ncbi:MAG: hypothetical protein H6Q73_1120 [Firmicutes bacterium]|nr:hypothetical protein [Bacillota bacterium]
MITIYHGRRQYWPLIACLVHLMHNTNFELSVYEKLSADWWKKSFIAMGSDDKGNAVCCLAHGAYRCLYRRALAGMAAVFGLDIVFCDIDYLLYQKLNNTRFMLAFVVIASYLPRFLWKITSRIIISTLIPAIICNQEELR